MGVQILLDPSLPPGMKSAYSPNDAKNIAKNHRTSFIKKNQIGAYLLFLDANSLDDTDTYRTLGQAYWNTSLVIYEPSVRKIAIKTGNSFQPYTKVESIVLLHEFGHLLGLVNNGTPLTTQHQDLTHGAHCDNPHCIMHYAIENGALTRALTTGWLPQLDANCIGELKANGGR